MMAMQRDERLAERDWGGLIGGVLIACVAAACGLLSGCAGRPAVSESSPTVDAVPVVNAAEASLTIDGDTSDWPVPPAAVDGRFLYLRLSTPEIYTLQATAPASVVAIDVDRNERTGRAAALTADRRMGVDVELVFSPPPPPEKPGGRAMGVAVRVYSRSGQMHRRSHADVQLVFAPTYAQPTYELRLDLGALSALLAREGAAAVSRQMTVKFVRMGGSGDAAMVYDAFDLNLPTMATMNSPLRVDVTLPAKPADAVRVLSYNVEFASPVKEPGPFAAVIKAVDPDVVFVQEWIDQTPEQIEQWFAAHVGGGPWRVRLGHWGTAVVSRLPFEAVGPDRVLVEGAGLGAEAGADGKSDRKADEPIRVSLVRARTPIGPMLLGAMHLTSRGSAGSREDERRIAEAMAINRLISSLPAATRERMVIGGDLNLVGSRAPLDILMTRIDADGSALSAAGALVLGERLVYTWRKDRDVFSPGQLDWLLYSDSSLRAVNAFAIETAWWSDAALARAGLGRDVSRASDHLPLVVDVSEREGSREAAR